jgi:predicted AAA+ superfamily ATPase
MLPVNFIKSSDLRQKKALLLGDGTMLVVDEVQKIPNWSESIKVLWDQQAHRLRVVLLGSIP